MSLFYKTANSILEEFISEQTEENSDVIDAESVVNQTIKTINDRIKNDSDGFRNESESKYNSGQEIEDALVKELNNVRQFIEEDVKTDLSNAWDALKQKGKEVWDDIAPKIADTQEFLADLAVENMGPIVRKTLGDEVVDDIRNKMSENFVYKVIAVLEPTGVMSWPYLANAKEAYESKIGTDEETIYQLNLLAAQISVIPGVRVPFRILTLPFRLTVGAPAYVLSKIFGAVGLKKIAMKLADIVKNTLGKAPRIEKAVEVISKAPQTTKVAKVASSKAANAVKTLPKTTTKTASTATKNASGKVIDAVKKPVKAAAAATGKAAKGAGGLAKKAGKVAATGAAAAKAATVIGSGDIPQTWKDWTKKGDDILSKLGNNRGSLGSFRSFRELSTQRF
jgi:hypothetical protein